jgi:uncharacterized protein YcbK (DUF882 family)
VTWSRRRALAAGGRLAAACAVGLFAGGTAGAAGGPAGRAAGSRARPGTAGSRRITLVNLHTPDRLDIEYARDGAYLPEALAAIQTLLRDYRTGDQHAIDPALMDYLYDVAKASGVDPVFSVISGYRSPRTNQMLHERSSGVSSRSLHMEGRAIDVRLAGTDCADLAENALGLQRGGVGYYRQSDFVHLDTGRFRTWRG